MALVFPRQQDLDKSSREGRGHLMMFWHRLSILSCVANVPHTQAVCKYTFHREVIEGHQQLLVQVVLPEDVQEVHILISDTAEPSSQGPLMW